MHERQKVAAKCINDLNFTCLTLVDKMDDRVNQAYTAMPERLAIVDKEGKLFYISAQGPWGYKPDIFEAEIKKLISIPKNSK